jgi:hypothetical protein
MGNTRSKHIKIKLRRTPMKKMYLLYQKSHCELPDLEDEVEAESKEEALEYFQKKHGDYISEKDVAGEDELQ